MRTNEEFKNEVYSRAEKEKSRIKRKTKIVMSVVPCIAVAVFLGAYGIWMGSMSCKSEEPIEEMETSTQMESTQNPNDLNLQDETEKATCAVAQKGESIPQKPSDNKGAVCYFVSRTFSVSSKNNLDKTQAVIVNSKQELTAFIKNNSDLAFDEDTKNHFNYYDEYYFNEQSLVIIVEKFKIYDDCKSPNVLFEINDNSLGINVLARRTDRREDLKILFVPLWQQKIPSDKEMDIIFS